MTSVFCSYARSRHKAIHIRAFTYRCSNCPYLHVFCATLLTFLTNVYCAKPFIGFWNSEILYFPFSPHVPNTTVFGRARIAEIFTQLGSQSSCLVWLDVSLCVFVNLSTGWTFSCSLIFSVYHSVPQLTCVQHFALMTIDGQTFTNIQFRLKFDAHGNAQHWSVRNLETPFGPGLVLLKCLLPKCQKNGLRCKPRCI